MRMILKLLWCVYGPEIDSRDSDTYIMLEPQTLNLRRQTLKVKPQTLNVKPQTLNYKP